MRRALPLLVVILFAGCVPSSASPEIAPAAVVAQPGFRAQLEDVLRYRVAGWLTGFTVGDEQVAVRRPAAPSAHPPGRRSASSSDGGSDVNGYPCGGDLPPCWVLRRESKGDPTAVNPTGCSGRSCGGLWQFDPRTWAGFGGYGYAQDAPADVQNAKAREVWAGGAGCSHWAACA